MANAVKIFNHFDTPTREGVYHRMICLTGENKGKAYFLMGKRVVMGRSEKTDITILDLKSSREHAEIILIGDNYILTDLGSQNGVVVNDLKVKQHTLSDGDKVIIGKTVYKFSKVEVKPKKKKVDVDDSNVEIEHDFGMDEEDKNKKLSMGLSVLIVFAILLLFLGDDTEVERKIKKKKTIQTQGIDDSFRKAGEERREEAKKRKEKLSIYFRRGLREFREGNYFRAISEFESAQQWSPNDPLANFYLRKTREALDEQIQSFFNKATRDIDAVNYQKAVTSYCAVIRLLNNFKTDKRYITAREGLTNLEKKMGLDEGELECKIGKD